MLQNSERVKTQRSQSTHVSEDTAESPSLSPDPARYPDASGFCNADVTQSEKPEEKLVKTFEKSKNKPRILPSLLELHTY